ncbi:MAG: MmgE/PrpD family protein [Actinobacteria bacterium]|nr:MmgE/PrpD family protein [Actinomycetota bacterium]
MAAKLFDLDIKKTCTSLRLSADQACGFRQYQINGNIANIAFHAAKAAENGIVATLLSKKDFAGPGETISGKFGFNCMAGECWFS